MFRLSCASAEKRCKPLTTEGTELHRGLTVFPLCDSVSSVIKSLLTNFTACAAPFVNLPFSQFFGPSDPKRSATYLFLARTGALTDSAWCPRMPGWPSTDSGPRAFFVRPFAWLVVRSQQT